MTKTLSREGPPSLPRVEVVEENVPHEASLG